LRVTIATGDMDTLQLVDEAVRVTFARAPRRGDFEYFDVAAVEARYGFLPERLVDYKALVGDTSDNIPGVPSIGQKTATKLIGEYGTLEAILAHVDALPARTATALRENEAQARQSKWLATIVRDAPVTLDLDHAHSERYDYNAVLALFRRFEFYSLVDRLPRPGDGAAPANGAPAPVEASGGRAPAAAALAAPSAAEVSGQLSLFEASDLQALAEEGTEIAAPGVAPAPRAPAAPPPATNTLVIDTPEGLDVLARALAAAPLIAFDLETDSTNEMHAQIVGISLSMGHGEAYYLPVGHAELPDGTPPGRQLPLADVLARIAPPLTNPAIGKVGHNAKYDMMVFARHGVWVEGLRSDTMVAAYLLNPGRRGLGLKDQAFEVLNLVMTPITELIGTGRQQITMAQTPIAAAALYAGADAAVTFRLMEALEPQLQARGLYDLFRDIEVPLVPVLARMELAGILVDGPFLKTMGAELEEGIAKLIQEIYDAVGHEFNVNSNKQLGDVLFTELKLPSGRKTKTGYSVDADTLDNLRGQHAMVDTLLDYRQLAKLKSTYVDGLIELTDPEDGRVHTSFSQVTAATGRLSSSNPNLQNIPVRTEVGRRIRRAFL
ncbi:MAG TPA: DNA polymerase, partial [Ktedonobacterales bacterium]|nr:DNA polymerase [Ktedonobacterales bacterium]